MELFIKHYPGKIYKYRLYFVHNGYGLFLDSFNRYNVAKERMLSNKNYNYATLKSLHESRLNCTNCFQCGEGPIRIKMK